MIKNYLTVAIRNIMRQKVYSAISILSLSVGMVCGILVLLFVQDEFKHATYHENGHRIFKVWQERTLSTGEKKKREWHRGDLALALRKQYPEIEAVGRTTASHFSKEWVRAGDKMFRGFFAVVDSEYLSIFDYPLIQGDTPSALAQPGSVVISERVAKQFFGDESPIGKVITSVPFEMDLEVTGVLKNVPKYAHLRFDFLALPHHAQPTPRFQRLWRGWNKIYVKLADGGSALELEQKLREFYADYRQDEGGDEILRLSSIDREYLYGTSGGPPRIGQIYYLTLFGLAVLLIACINFMNLATARSTGRAKEVGIRKVVGAIRQQLTFQFMGESVLLAFVALLLACGLAQVVLPTFNDLMTSGKSAAMALGIFSDGRMLLGFVGLALIVGILAGSYPALFLSAFQPVDTLKGRVEAKGAGFRKGLIVFQFTLSIGLILSTVVMNKQMQFVEDRDLGFDKDVVVLSPILQADPSLRNRSEAIKQSFLQHPNVLHASRPRHVPPEVKEPSVVYPNGDLDNARQAVVVGVDEHYMETFGMSIVSGRNFDVRIASDTTAAVLVNETAVKTFGWQDPIGQMITYNEQEGRVIGVVKDFHYHTLYHPIGPAVLHYALDHGGFSFRISAQNIPETKAFLRETWSTWVPHRPPQFQFLSSWIDFNYAEDHRMSHILNLVAGLAIVVACLGLLGLVSFTVAQRSKEIGIRKVLGASVSNLVMLLSKDFVKLVVVANVIAWPVVYYVMRTWLQNYVYRIELEVWIFALGGAASFVVALMTVSSQTIRSAMTNPVDVLRDE